jgi:2-furoyl-CoA dehydrogenase large subunit
LGGALWEELAYDSEGQFLAGTFMDYLVPSASQAPTVEVEHLASPSPFTTLGAKGLGEASSMTAPAAVANAVSDALAPLGVRITELPITPSRLWHLLEAAKRKQR